MNDELRSIFDELDYAVSKLSAVLAPTREPFEAGLQYSYRKLSRALRLPLNGQNQCGHRRHPIEGVLWKYENEKRLVDTIWPSSQVS
jgi:hypothetical protein